VRLGTRVVEEGNTPVNRIILNTLRARRGAAISATVLALVIASTALAGTGVGGTFQLGASNTVNGAGTTTGTTTLAGTPTLANPQLRIRNNGNGAALDLQVDSYRAALTINSNVKVANLNADLLDGINSTGFIRGPVSAWHEVGAPGEIGFHCTPVVTSCFADYGNYTGSSGYNTAGFYRDPLGVVHLKGLVQPINLTATNVACHSQSFFTLPVGFRPAAIEIAPALHNDAPARIDVLPTGEVTICLPRAYNSGDWFLLDGINFRAAH
jgi:hypothetical protein